MKRRDAKPFFVRFVIAGAIMVTASGALAAEPARKPFDADAAIERCLAYASAQKLPALSVGVIDATGTLLAFKRQAGASPATADVALMKARTALRLNAPTSVLGPAAASDAAARDTFLLLQMVTMPGGEPLPDGAGAIGVSGAPADQDAECAQRAATPGS